MTKPTETAIANGKAQILASMREHTERLQAMPDQGSVLYNRTSHLALHFVDGDLNRPQAGGLPWAEIFPADIAPIQQGTLCDRYRDGAGGLYSLMSLGEAKALALQANAEAIALVDQHVAKQISALTE